MSKNELTIIKQEGNQYFVRIPTGRKLSESMKEVLQKTKAKSLFCFALGGGLKNVQAYLSQSQKIHGSNPNLITLPNPGGPGIYELNNAIINITTLESNNEPFIHTHASLTGGEDLKTSTGGHIVDADVDLTIEMKVFASNVKILRGTNKETGLPLKLTSKGAGRFSDGEIVIIVSFVTMAV